jgi:hypothetical protein
VRHPIIPPSPRKAATSRLIAAALIALAASSTLVLAGPRNDDPAEQRIIAYNARLPGCADGGVIGEISGEFASRESTYWNTGLTIAGIDRIGELGFRPWGADFIPRRFCTARVMLSNQQFATVSYSVREGLGLIGWTWDVNWCVTGLDRHKTYSPECKMARP